MSLIKLPEIKADASVKNAQWDMRPDALERWEPRAAIDDEPGVISIYDPIGMDPWTGEGVTAKRISAALRSMAGRDVQVNINSPGGDFFEGVTIYNLLREHPAKVTTRVLGVAASCASIIAMAGDEIEISIASSLMVHNAWSIAVGNRHDFEKVIDVLEPFDAVMADVYHARTGIDRKKIVSMMDAETWIGADRAIADGWADRKINEPERAAGIESRARKTLALAESAFARSGMSRSERRNLLKDLTSGTPSAAAHAMPGAGDLAASLRRLQDATRV